MAKYRDNLPQLSGDLFLTDGGLETTLIYHNGFSLPDFAAFVLLQQEEGVRALQSYYQSYADIAISHGLGFILESATWRASRDWGKRLEFSETALAKANYQAVDLLRDIRDRYETPKTKMVISGCLGPRGDGYNVSGRMSVEEAERYHKTQIRTFAETEADMVTAFTLSYSEEAIGIARAAESAGIPVAISFTVETNGALPSGQRLKDAIEEVDAATDNAPVYFMINCAHPTHFNEVLENQGVWTDRIRAVRANASARSHAELDEATELDNGDPIELGRQYRSLRESLKKLNVLGGCCGTDARHLEEICQAVLS